MTQDQIMKLVDGYVEASAKYEHIIEHYAQTEFQIAQAKDDLAKVRAAVVAALEVRAQEMARIRELWEADQIESSEQRTQIHQLREQVEALAKDAERYNWLRDQHWVEPEARFRLGLSDTENGSEYENELNQAIDAAIAAQKGQV